MKEKFSGIIMSVELPRQAFKIKRDDDKTPIRFYADDCMFNKVLSFIGKTNLDGQKATAKFEVHGRVLTKFTTAEKENKTGTILDFVRMLSHSVDREPLK